MVKRWYPVVWPKCVTLADDSNNKQNRVSICKIFDTEEQNAGQFIIISYTFTLHQKAARYTYIQKHKKHINAIRICKHIHNIMYEPF